MVRWAEEGSDEEDGVGDQLCGGSKTVVAEPAQAAGWELPPPPANDGQVGGQEEVQEVEVVEVVFAETHIKRPPGRTPFVRDENNNPTTVKKVWSTTKGRWEDPKKEQEEQDQHVQEVAAVVVSETQGPINKKRPRGRAPRDKFGVEKVWDANKGWVERDQLLEVNAVVVEETPMAGQNQGKSTTGKEKKKKRTPTLGEELVNTRKKLHAFAEYQKKTKEEVAKWTAEAAKADFGYSALRTSLGYLENQEAAGASLDEPVQFMDRMYASHGQGVEKD